MFRETGRFPGLDGSQNDDDGSQLTVVWVRIELIQFGQLVLLMNEWMNESDNNN